MLNTSTATSNFNVICDLFKFWPSAFQDVFCSMVMMWLEEVFEVEIIKMTSDIELVICAFRVGNVINWIKCEEKKTIASRASFVAVGGNVNSTNGRITELFKRIGTLIFCFQKNTM